MPSTSLPCATVHPALLLVDPGLAVGPDRAAQFERLDYCVTRTDSAKDIWLMRHALRFSVAVLHDAIGHFALRASSRLVRAQWPFARILILGHAPRDLEDFLYDEAVVHATAEEALRAVVRRLVEDQWKHSGNGDGLLQDYDLLTPRQIASWIVQESDPTKGGGQWAAFPSCGVRPQPPWDAMASGSEGAGILRFHVSRLPGAWRRGNTVGFCPAKCAQSHRNGDGRASRTPERRRGSGP